MTELYDHSFFAGRSETVALSASVVVPVLRDMIAPTSVLDIGCGQGVPGQEGKGHINCQPHEYWHAYFSLYEFEHLDSIRPLIQDSRVSPWYRDNIFLYVHGG